MSRLQSRSEIKKVFLFFFFSKMDDFNLDAFAYKVCSFDCRLRERKSDRVKSLCVFYRHLSVRWCICMWRWEKDLSWHTRARTHTRTHTTHTIRTHTLTRSLQRDPQHTKAPQASQLLSEIDYHQLQQRRKLLLQVVRMYQCNTRRRVYYWNESYLKCLISQTYRLFGLKITDFTTCTHTHTYTHTHTHMHTTHTHAHTPTHKYTHTHTHTHT